MLSRIIKKILERQGLYLRKNVHLPSGTDLTVDLKRMGENISCIFDIGANIGQSAHEYRRAFPNSQIYCFEPIAQTFNILRSALSSDQGTHCYQLALGDSQGKQRVRLQEEHQWNSLVAHEPVPDSDRKGWETIQVDRLDNIVKRLGVRSIDFLKIDTEGYELQVLRGADQTIKASKIPLILAECGFHSEDSRHTPMLEIADHLRHLGYAPVAFYDQSVEKQQKTLLYANVLFRNLNRS